MEHLQGLKIRGRLCVCICVWGGMLEEPPREILWAMYCSKGNEGQREMTSRAHSFSLAFLWDRTDGGCWLPSGMNALGVAHGKSSS